MNTKVPDYVLVMRDKSAKRRADMRKLRERGLTLQAIGDRYGIGRERVRQILNKPE